MSVLPPPWPSQPWISQSSFSALAAPVIPPLDPSDHSPFPSPTHAHSPFSALAASPPRHFTHPMHTSRHQQSPVPIPGPSFAAGLPQHNERPLDKPALLQILSHLSHLLPRRFGGPGMRQIRLVVHGGAVMLLNPALAHLPTPRTTTRDIDYIARAFSAEWASSVPDANDRLRQCIFETAAHFGLGTDWMNSDADVALPMASNPTTGALYDPIHAAALTANGGTVYTSPNGLLKLVSPPPIWLIALKLVRFNAMDREDICVLLRSAVSPAPAPPSSSRTSYPPTPYPPTPYTQTQQQWSWTWTPALLERWLIGTCGAMGYAGYDAARIGEVRGKMREVVVMVASANSANSAYTAYPTAGNEYYYGGGASDPRAGSPFAQAPASPFALGGGGGGDPRVSCCSPFAQPQPQSHSSGSPAPAFSFGAAAPPSYSPPPFIPPPPPPPPPKTKTKKHHHHSKKKTKGEQTADQTATAVTTWPSQWTHLRPSSALEPLPWPWGQDVQPAPPLWEHEVHVPAEKKMKEKEKRGGWLPPFFKSSTKKQQRRYDSDSESESESEESGESEESEEEDWAWRERSKWGTEQQRQRLPPPTQTRTQGQMQTQTPTPPPWQGAGVGAGATWGLGSGAGVPRHLQTQTHTQTPPPWAYQPQQQQQQQRQRSPPVQQQQQQQRQASIGQVAAGMNALGLYS